MQVMQSMRDSHQTARVCKKQDLLKGVNGNSREFGVVDLVRAGAR
jgi:hypothetical protein